MKKLKIVFILIILVSFLQSKLSESKPELKSLKVVNSTINIPFMLAFKILDIHDLLVSWLWVRFDLDSVGFVRNYHRLLSYLDLITIIKPDEFQAYGLKTYMRILRYQKEENLKQINMALAELKDAANLYPDLWRGQYEVAFNEALLLKNYTSALAYANRAYLLENNNETRELLNYVSIKHKQDFLKQNPNQTYIDPLTQVPLFDLDGYKNEPKR